MVVEAASVVNKPIEANMRVAGIPAKAVPRGGVLKKAPEAYSGFTGGPTKVSHIVDSYISQVLMDVDFNYLGLGI